MMGGSAFRALLHCHNSTQVFWFPWYWQRTDTAQLRKSVARIEWLTNPTLKGKAKLIIKMLLWPLIAAVALIIAWCMFSGGRFVLGHRSRCGQLWDLIAFTFWYGFSPVDYYEMRIYAMDLREKVPLFISHYETKILSIFTNGSHVDEVKDKSAFTAVCKTANLPIVDDIGEIVEDQAEAMPKKDLFLKPSSGHKGKGIERWDYDNTTSSWSFDGDVLCEDELRAHIKCLSSNQSYIVQYAQKNNSSIAQLSPGGLITFRVTTIYGNQDEPIVIGAFMTCPTNDAVTNHEVYGGMLARIDLQTACVGPGFSEVPKMLRHDQHPATGAQVTGIRLNCLDEVLTLAKQTHAHFPGVFSVGWDIAFTETGVQLLEGNTFWAMEVGLFLGETEYVAKYLDLLKSKFNSV